MKADIIYRGRVRTEQFPMNSYQLADLCDQMRCEFPFNVRIERIFDWSIPNNSFTINSMEDMQKLNLLIQQLEHIDSVDEAKMFALINKFPESDIDDLLYMTYGLDSVEIYPCSDADDLTELALNNDWLPEFKGCPFEVYKYLDNERVANRVIELRSGCIFDGYYIEPDSYVRPDIEIEMPEPEKGFFRLMLMRTDSDGRPDHNRARWMTLPCSSERIGEIEKWLGCNIENAFCYDKQSALPKLSRYQIGVEKIYELNDLAHKLSELSHFEFIKLKAVMEHYDIKIISDTNRAVEHLLEFSFDPMSMDASVFGKAYLFNNLPIGFDTEIFSTADMEDFGRSILSAKGGGMTSYGAVSGRGQSLFAPVAKQPDEEETEDIEDDESEDEAEGLEAVLT